jgi:hypothetical protein
MSTEIDIDFCIETMYELLLDGSLPEEICLRLINHYNELKESGQQTIVATIRL